MNKFGIVFSAAAVVVMAGCKSPEYARKYESKNTVKTCTCAPGTKHTAPCGCGASDCRCAVVAPAPKPVAVAPAPKPVVTPAPKPAVPAPVAPAPEYTTYIVQNGDYLAKISKRYNVTIASIRKLNPSIKKDIVRVGQKIKLPGKVDVGVQRTPAASAVAPAKRKGKKAYVSYTGATREYVVKSGDSLGAIAYGNGITIRQLKELNSLKNDRIAVGQKLKIPAGKGVSAPAPKKAAAPAAKKVVAEQLVKTEEKKLESAPALAAPAPAPVQTESAQPAAEESQPAAVAPAPAPAAPAAETTTYVVQEGDDMTGVSIRWGVSAAAIRELNNLNDGDQLKPGQIIKLPAEAQQ